MRFVKMLKDMDIAWFDGDYEMYSARVYEIPYGLAALLINHGYAAPATMQDCINDVMIWSGSVVPKLGKKEIQQFAREVFTPVFRENGVIL